MNLTFILDKSKSQGADLGIQTEAFMAQPGIDGATGGALSFTAASIRAAGGRFYSIFLSFYQVNEAVSLDRTRSQWIDLGIHTEACMTRPETCGAAGGAISLWVKLFDSPFLGGVISSDIYGYSGSVIFSHYAWFMYALLLCSFVCTQLGNLTTKIT